MRSTTVIAALLIASLPLAALAPAAAAETCPNGYVGVLVPQPSGNPFGTCCRLGQPMVCQMYRLDEPPVLP